MKIRLADLWDGPMDIEGELDPAPYDLQITGEEKWSPLKYKFHLEILGEEVLIQGNITSTVQIPCGRCLEPLPVPINLSNFTQAIPFTTEESIDLTLSIREDILLSLPMVASCHLDASNKCPHTGKVYKEGVDTFTEQRRSEVWGPLDKFKEERE